MGDRPSHGDPRHAKGQQRDLHVLARRQSGQQVIVLEQEAHAPRDAHLSVRRSVETTDQLEKRALSRARRARDRDSVTGVEE